MKRTNRVLASVLILCLCFSQYSLAQEKRQPPKEIESVTYKGVRYTAPHWGWTHGKMQNGGYVEAWDVKTGKLLWEMQAYVVSYNPDIESDLQDIFITSLKVEEGILIVENDSGGKFAIDLNTRQVAQQ